MLPIDPKLDIKADLDPVLKATPSSIRFIFDLILGDRHNAAQRRRRLSEAQVDSEVEKIQNGTYMYEHSSGELVSLETAPLLSSVASSIADEEAKNIIACGVQASEFISKDASGESISSTFLNRWRAEARLVSEKELQFVWGKILAEEVNKPNTVSLRTLDVIRNLTQSEAVLFRKACRYVVADSLVVEGVRRGDGRLTPAEFKQLLDAGLISSYNERLRSSKAWPTTSVTTKEKITFSARYLQIYDNFVYIDIAKVANYDDGVIPGVVCWELTGAAIQLYRMIIKDLNLDLTALVSVLLEERESLKSCVWAGKYVNLTSSAFDSETLHIDSDSFHPLFE